MSYHEKEVEVEIRGGYTMDGAGVKLFRVFGGKYTFPRTDPFLLMDYFGSNDPVEYEKGFPWHPHRGIETVTYQIKGNTSHEDSNGNRGRIFPGDIQSMSAGSGIYHEEMPGPSKNTSGEILSQEVLGVQLWVNIPSRKKMSTPAYAYHKSSGIPEISEGNHTKIRVVSGKFEDVTGPYESFTAKGITYIHMKIGKDEEFTLSGYEGKRVIVFCFSGSVRIGEEANLEERNSYSLSVSGDWFNIKGINEESDLIIIGGEPTGENIEWYGPIVMSTKEEISEAIRDLNTGTFVKSREPIIL
ncbi:pirin family protein [Cuniculiplasma sp. SKW4]|uniref:pirin family protein n=1 Tax=Cuniculiplasma sp. SKW4 TaxID=3400171 RepID=UPI003FD46336